MENIVQEITNNFTKLTFNEERHEYKVEDTKLDGSVSSRIDKFVDKVDFNAIAYSMAKTYGMPPEDIIAQWDRERDEACDTGNRVHLFGEKYAFDRSLVPSCGQEKAVVKFWNDLPPHIVPACIELRMYHFFHMFAGTSDILLYDTINKVFIIADYKTNKDLFKNYKKKTLKPPFQRLLDSPFNKYQIQLSFYQLLFEQTGYKVSSRKIIWLLKTGEYIMYDTEDLTKELIRELEK